MERGSKLAVKKFKLVEPKNGKPFYYVTLMETVVNRNKPYKEKRETVFYEAYIFDTNIELECADFSLDKSTYKYSVANVSNKDKSIIIVNDFSFEYRTIWKDGVQVTENGLPKYKAMFYITDFDLGKRKAKTEAETKVVTKTQVKLVEDKRKIRSLESKINKLEEKITQLRSKNSEMSRKNKDLRKQRNKRSKMVAEERKERKNAQKELQSYKQENNIKDEYAYDMDNISFSDM